MADKVFHTWFTEKTTPIWADKIMISDSENSNATKFTELKDLPISDDVQTALNWKADITYVDLQTYDAYINALTESKSYTDSELLTKVDKVTWKSLILDTEITRLLTIETGAEVNITENVTAWTNITINRVGKDITINSTATWWASSLDWLTDVVITTPTTWQALVYDGTEWKNNTVAWGWDMFKSENLSWLDNYATARQNLWLDTTANQTDSTDKRFMTDAQKNKLDWIEALAEVNNISDVNATDLTDWWDTSLHTHDLRYYTETETDNLLNAKANLSWATFTWAISATNLSWTNTWDQDLSWLALKSNVLELDNTTPFTPDTDYEPATKKYVDDNAGWGFKNVSNLVYDLYWLLKSFTADGVNYNLTYNTDGQPTIITNGGNTYTINYNDEGVITSIVES